MHCCLFQHYRLTSTKAESQPSHPALTFTIPWRQTSASAVASGSGIRTAQVADLAWEEVAIAHQANLGLDVEAIENFGNGF